MNLRIIFSTDTLSRGGKERQMAVLAAHLQKGNFKLEFLAKRTDFENSFFQEYNINGDQIKIYKGFQNYRSILKDFKPDIVVSWDITSSFYNLLLYRKSGFVFINGSIRHGIRLLKLTHFYRSILCHLSPFVIANSIAGLHANNLKPGKRRFVLYNGIETKFRNKLTETEIIDLRKKLITGYNENPGFVYISVANFVPYKDYFTVLKALKRLQENYFFYYLILGDGPMRDKIEKNITDFGLKKKVILIGRTENVRDYLFASDLMIHSSRGEGISNAILEAMYAGLPVIATNVGGIPETVFTASSKLFPYKDHGALYQCLLNSQELKVNFDFHSEAYQAHLAKFSVTTMINRFVEIIKSIKSLS